MKFFEFFLSTVYGENCRSWSQRRSRTKMNQVRKTAETYALFYASIFVSVLKKCLFQY
jgi:hypothetical protein